jgi:2-phospho-L-lactate guanylyltransferase
MKAVLIPLKDPTRAKTRLGSILSPGDRSRLVWSMFEDVAAAVQATTLADAIAVVTSFQPALDYARAAGWQAIVESEQTSESESVDRASRILLDRGFESVLRLPADLPLAQAPDIDQLLSIELRAPAALVVPSRDGSGTNALARTPPDLFPSHFGLDSFAIHKREAERAGAQFVVVANERLALDIDDPSDVEAFLELGAGTRTFDFLWNSRN